MRLSSDKPAMARPSLYTTIRLARIVQQVKERLMSCKHRRSAKMALEHRSMNDVVLHTREVIDE